MYPAISYELVKQAIDSAGTVKLWPVFQELDKIMQKRYDMKRHSYQLWKRVLGITHTSDLEKIIQEVVAGDMETDYVPQG